jgi:hypothetical protein
LANTTFSGSVRSEDNFKLVSKNTTTGLIQDRTKASGLKDTRRYYLEEYFVQLPKLNAVNIIDPDADDASALALHVLANKNFEVLGTNMTSALSTRNATAAGITLTTAGADQDQAIVLPHLDSNQTAWTGTKWGTENQTIWECSINTNAIDNQKLWAGGTAVTSGTTKSGAMTDDIDLIPYIGIEAGAAAAEAVDVHYQCISRTIFE